MLSRTRANILVVDDNPANLLSLKAILSDSGELMTASSGRDALRQVLEHEFAVILLDVHMPEMDGFETAALLRQHRRSEHTPIIFVTAVNTSHADMSRGYSLGAIDYVSKPLVPAVLKAKVAAFVDLFEHRRALREINERLEEQIQERTAQLFESERRFRQLSESVPVGILLLDEHGNCEYSNPRWRLMSGLSAEQSIGTGWKQAIHHQDSEQLFGDWNKRREHSLEWSGEHRMIQPNGTVIWGHSRITGFHSDSGDPSMYVYSVMDITEYRESKERKASLEEQLRQSQKLEAVGTLAGGIAHDFNNILAIIVSSIELAMRQMPEESEPSRTLKLARDATSRGTAVVRQLLYFSRPQLGDRKVLDCKRELGQALNLLRPALPATVEITSMPASECPPIIANDTQFHQIVMNLGMNAWHAMPSGCGRLTFSLGAAELEEHQAKHIHPDLHAGLYTKLTVTDDGVGMDRSTVERIFEPFFTTRGPGEGSGLGLSVVHGIIQGHGGAITVETEVGNGSSFHIYLPAAIPAGNSLAEIESLDFLPGQGQKISVVDDERILLNLRKQTLDFLGYEVTIFTNPVEALNALVKKKIEVDLLITDLSMPGMSGLELAAAVHAHRPDLPMILCTGYEPTVTEEALAKIGIFEVLRKPTSVDLLKSSISRVLLRRSRKMTASSE